METSDVIAIIAIIVSFISAGFTVYMQFFYKIEEVFINLVSCVGKHESQINLQLVVHNNGNQSVSITNCFIVFNGIDGEYIKSDYTMSFEPFVLKGKEQKIIEISDFTPQLEHNIKHQLSLNISTTYVNTKGQILMDHFYVGRITVHNQLVLENIIGHSPHKLDGSIMIATL